jgi:argininosuccinate lyase
MKLWEKEYQLTNRNIHCRQRQRTDLVLAKYDALGSIAHAKMLGSIGLLTSTETEELVAALNEIIADVAADNFEIERFI